MEQFHARLLGYLQQGAREQVRTLREGLQRRSPGRRDDITPAVTALVRDFPHETTWGTWGRLAERLGWLRSDQGKRIDAALQAPDGRVLTYPEFEKRLARARAALKGKPKK